MSEKGNKPTVDYLIRITNEYDEEEMDCSDDEFLLLSHLLEGEGVSLEDISEIVHSLDIIVGMQAVSAQLIPDDIRETDYGARILKILKKYSSRLPKVRERLAEEVSEKEDTPTVDHVLRVILNSNDEVASEIAKIWPTPDLFMHLLEGEGVSLEDIDEIMHCLSIIENMDNWEYEFTNAPLEIMETDPSIQIVQILKKYSSLLPKVREKLANDCPYSDWQTVDCDEPLPNYTFLVCTTRPEKNPCPEGLEICCAQCDLIDTCPHVCSHFEGIESKQQTSTRRY